MVEEGVLGRIHRRGRWRTERVGTGAWVRKGIPGARTWARGIGPRAEGWARVEIEPRVVGAHGGLEVMRGLRGVEVDLDLGSEVGVEVDLGEGDSAWPSDQGKVGGRQGGEEFTLQGDQSIGHGTETA
jgi:hypothetical protein